MVFIVWKIKLYIQGCNLQQNGSLHGGDDRCLLGAGYYDPHKSDGEYSEVFDGNEAIGLVFVGSQVPSCCSSHQCHNGLFCNSNTLVGALWGVSSALAEKADFHSFRFNCEA